MASLTLGVIFSMLSGLCFCWLNKKFDRPAHWHGHAYRLSLSRSCLMIVFFLKYSFLGAVAISRSTFQKNLSVNTSVVEYQFTLLGPVARTFLAYLQNLMPGTLNVQLKSKSMMIHILGDQASAIEGLNQLEAALSACFVPMSAIVNVSSESKQEKTPS